MGQQLRTLENHLMDLFVPKQCFFLHLKSRNQIHTINTKLCQKEYQNYQNQCQNRQNHNRTNTKTTKTILKTKFKTKISKQMLDLVHTQFTWISAYFMSFYHVKRCFQDKFTCKNSSIVYQSIDYMVLWVFVRVG